VEVPVLVGMKVEMVDMIEVEMVVEVEVETVDTP
jgi:hypothetical protein